MSEPWIWVRDGENHAQSGVRGVVYDGTTPSCRLAASAAPSLTLKAAAGLSVSASYGATRVVLERRAAKLRRVAPLMTSATTCKLLRPCTWATSLMTCRACDSTATGSVAHRPTRSAARA